MRADCPLTSEVVVLVDQFDVFLLDLDGVVYVGDTLLSGVTEALASLRSRGRVVRFVTNDPRPSRKDVVHRLGRAAQGHLPQGRQVLDLEEILGRQPRRLGPLRSMLAA